MSGAPRARFLFPSCHMLWCPRFRFGGHPTGGPCLQRGKVHHPGISWSRRSGLGGPDRVQRGEGGRVSRWRGWWHGRGGRYHASTERWTRRDRRFDWWGRRRGGRGFRHDSRNRAVDQRRRRHRRLRRGRHRDARRTRVFGIGGAQLESPVIGSRFVCIVAERQIAKALASRRLLDVPGGVAGRAIPRCRAGQPGVLRQALALDRGAHRTGAVNPDLVRGTPASSRGKTRVDAAEILVDLVQRPAARVEIDRKVDRATRRLADCPRLAIGGQRVGVAGGIGEVDRVGRMPLPHGDDLHPGGRKALRLGRRQCRPARAGVAVVARDEMKPRPALQFAGDIAGIGRHVDAVDAGAYLRHWSGR